MIDKRRVTIAESVEQCKIEVRQMLAAPFQTSRGVETLTPAQITSFGDLHDYCDANVLGWLCNEDVIFVDEQGEIPDGQRNDGDNDRWMEFGNKVQDQVDAWIKAAGHHLPAEWRECRHCGRSIVLSAGIWIDPEATEDDFVWRETCDRHDTFTAEHEPVEKAQDCPACGTGTLMLTAQTNVGRPAQGGPWHVSEVTTDDFIDLSCDNVQCLVALQQSPGDGRLRRAALTVDGYFVEDRPELLEQFLDIAEKAIAMPESPT